MVANNNIENKSGADERIYWKAQSDFHQSDSLTFTARKIASIYFTEHQQSVLATLWKKSATVKLAPSTNLVQTLDKNSRT